MSYLKSLKLGTVFLKLNTKYYRNSTQLFTAYNIKFRKQNFSNLIPNFKFREKNTYSRKFMLLLMIIPVIPALYCSNYYKCLVVRADEEVFKSVENDAEEITEDLKKKKMKKDKIGFRDRKVWALININDMIRKQFNKNLI